MDTVIFVWANYLRIAYCLQHFALTVSNFILVVASVERFLANSSHYYEKRLLVFMVSHKAFVITIIIFLSTFFKATLYFETDLLKLPQCGPMESLIPIWLTDRSSWKSTRFWIRKVFTIILPFLILAYCNLHIVLHLKKRKRKFEQVVTQSQRIAIAAGKGAFRRSLNKNLENMENFDPGFSKKKYSEKRGVRVATRTLAMVVGCYLISNTATTIINIWEYFDLDFWRYRHYYAYLVASDLAALLTICGCALRLPIYMFNDHRIRKAIFRALLRLRYKRGGKFHDLQAAGNLEKWSIVIVSNSLRSNLTGMLSQDYQNLKAKKSFDQLGILVQNRRRFLVQMTINLGKELPPKNRNGSIGADVTFLTDIQEEEHSELLNEQRTSDYESTDVWKSWRTPI
ncbi:hypothetical protein FO519_005827 [Halicephalobus sp. NKZ332]|nr:hypothetical protein FO519_005827 [Halicephalobus sp. NKZ332]